MARAGSTFKQRDVTRAMRAAAAAGREVKRVEIDREGRIVLRFDEEPTAPPDGGDEWGRI